MKNRWGYLDEPFSEAIRRRAIRDAGGCERCLTQKHDIQKDNGKIYPAWKQLDCAHYYGRTTFSTRWSEDNCAGLCGGCHFYFDDHRREFDRWMLERLGERRFLLLEIQSQRRDKADKVAVGLYLKAWLKKLVEAKYPIEIEER